MPEFSYEALANGGQRNKGTLTANSEREVMAMLDARGLFPVTIAPVKPTASHRWGRKIKARLYYVGEVPRNFRCRTRRPKGQPPKGGWKGKRVDNLARFSSALNRQPWHGLTLTRWTLAACQ